MLPVDVVSLWAVLKADVDGESVVCVRDVVGDTGAVQEPQRNALHHGSLLVCGEGYHGLIG